MVSVSTELVGGTGGKAQGQEGDDGDDCENGLGDLVVIKMIWLRALCLQSGEPGPVGIGGLSSGGCGGGLGPEGDYFWLEMVLEKEDALDLSDG
jgi:hypothetical protein